MKVAVPGTQLTVSERGTGPPLILIHGGTGTGDFDWEPVRDRLSRRFRTIAADMRGHGGSPAPGWQLGIVRYGLDVQHVMRALGIPRALMVGFSAGANSLLTLAMRRPGLISGLVVIGASKSSAPERIEEILSGPWPANLKAIEHTAAESGEHWKKLREALARDWVANNSFSDADIGRITSPTLVVHGTADRTVPVEQATMLEGALPDAEIWLAEGARHMVQHDTPDAFAEKVEEFADRIGWV